MTALEIKLKAYEDLIENIGHLIDDDGFETEIYNDGDGPYMCINFKIDGVKWYCIAQEQPRGAVAIYAFSMDSGQKIDDFVKSVKAIQMKTKKD